ncbi:MAG: hypothetical protein K0Q72_3506 [Armatimonadetes bacterium]|nr:hypothetical protein [Armatimonadota bacterium]
MSFARRLAAASAAAVLSIGLAAVPARAQAPDTDKKITVNLKDIPLRAAIDALFAGTGQQYAVNPDVQNVPVNLNIRDIGLQAGLRLLLRQAAIAQPGVTLANEGGVFVVKVRNQTLLPVTVDAEDAPPEFEVEAATWEKIPIQFNNVAVFVLAFGGTMLPTEADVLLGGLGGGFGGGFGGGGIGGGALGGGGFGGGLGNQGFGGGLGNQSFGGGQGGSFGGLNGSSFGGGSFGGGQGNGSFGGGNVGGGLGNFGPGGGGRRF